MRRTRRRPGTTQAPEISCRRLCHCSDTHARRTASQRQTRECAAWALPASRSSSLRPQRWFNPIGNPATMSIPMAPSIRIGIVSDFEPSYHSHFATNAALYDAATALKVQLEIRWVPTPLLADGDAEQILGCRDGLIASPGSP